MWKSCSTVINTGVTNSGMLNTIVCGDCVGGMKSLDNNSVDLVFTSPPYNCGNKGKNKDMYKFYSDNLTNEQYLNLLDESLHESLRICKGLVFYNLNFMRNNTSTLLEFLFRNKDVLRDIMVWDKMRVQPPIGNILGKRCEFIFIFSKDPKTVINDFRNNKATKYKDVFGSWLSNICQIGIKTDKIDAKLHRAGFPVDLPKIFIDMYTEPGGVVLDPFMGCGATAMAAKALNRHYIGYELNKEYVDIANKRLYG